MNGSLTMSWDITNKCNFNCEHCLNRSGDQNKHDFSEELNKTEIINCIEQIIELNPETICLCGGEPTMNPFIFEITCRLRRANIKVNMVSNGSFMDKKSVESLKEVDIYR
ncbi:hypothetical protein DLH72_03495 [Candidatus Gracilibacteria bacterium]|nr:MAG: hypothetical protein DLH72_03495 [Candidatus Gracilibacteria bacterium]